MSTHGANNARARKANDAGRVHDERAGGLEMAARMAQRVGDTERVARFTAEAERERAKAEEARSKPARTSTSTRRRAESSGPRTAEQIHRESSKTLQSRYVENQRIIFGLRTTLNEVVAQGRGEGPLAAGHRSTLVEMEHEQAIRRYEMAQRGITPPAIREIAQSSQFHGASQDAINQVIRESEAEAAGTRAARPAAEEAPAKPTRSRGSSARAKTPKPAAATAQEQPKQPATSGGGTRKPSAVSEAKNLRAERDRLDAAYTQAVRAPANPRDPMEAHRAYQAWQDAVRRYNAALERLTPAQRARVEQQTQAAAAKPRTPRARSSRVKKSA